MKKEDELIISLSNCLFIYNLFFTYYWLKKIMKQAINLDNIPQIENVLKQLGLKYILSDFFYTNSQEWCTNDFWFKNIYIWKNHEDIEKWKNFDEQFECEFYRYPNWKKTIDNSISNYINATKWLWNLLWYPECCIERFLKKDCEDKALFYSIEKSIVDYKNCSIYLNYFEDTFIHHIPCSFNCEKSIWIAKNWIEFKILPIAKENKMWFKNSLIMNRIYILFKNLYWIKIIKDNYYFWGEMKVNDDNTFFYVKDMIKNKWYSIFYTENLEKDNIILKKWNNKIKIQDVLVMYFNK